MGELKPDFVGWATKAGLECTDGRTIMKDAFAHQNKAQVPLVWRHGHDDVENVLGHAILENRPEGVWCEGYFNDSTKGLATKKIVQHRDISMLSIYANQLVQRGKQVFHGMIREVSLVLAGANPGATIEDVAVHHSDGDWDEPIENAAIIYNGVLVHSDDSEEEQEITHDSTSERTVLDVYKTFDDEQKEVVHYLIERALEAAPAVEHSDDDSSEDEGSDESTPTEPDDSSDSDEEETEEESSTEDDNSEDEESNDNTEDNLNHQEGIEMTTNVFEQDALKGVKRGPTLTHDQISTLLSDAKKPGQTLKDAFLAHAGEYGIDNMDLLFPDAKTLATTPDFIARRTEWVAKVLDGTKHLPFAKVKSLAADITAEEARAKGYIKGNQKKEEVFPLLTRSTGPATVYKKQKLDRDDIIDITDLDVVAFLKMEMRLMIEEEVARAILVGDGRSTLSEDKIKDPAGAIDGIGIRSILHDADLYSVKVEMAANVSPKDAVKQLVRARSKYRGTGKPTLFISDAELTDIMLEEDKFGRALYETEQALKDKLRVDDVITVDLFDEYDNLFAILVSLIDYSVGSNLGGQLTSFEQFDIDFNQNKYLQETRLSGGLTKPFSAIVVNRAVGTKATATTPSFNGTTDMITVPTATGVDYTIDDDVVTGDVHITGPTEVVARPKTGYYLESNTTRSWTYTP